MADGRPIMDKLVSPHGFDGHGDVPKVVTEACRRIASLRVHFLTGSALTAIETDDLFYASTLVAEWLREVTEARDDPAALAAHWTPEQWRVALKAGIRAGMVTTGARYAQPGVPGFWLTEQSDG